VTGAIGMGGRALTRPGRLDGIDGASRPEKLCPRRLCDTFTRRPSLRGSGGPKRFVSKEERPGRSRALKLLDDPELEMSPRTAAARAPGSLACREDVEVAIAGMARAARATNQG